MDFIKDVEDFHRKFHHGEGPKPRVLPMSLYDFRVKFHREEVTEYEDAGRVIYEELKRLPEFRDRLVLTDMLENQLDALVDSVWVLLGTAEVQFGADRFREAWSRVVKANMEKVRADQAEDYTPTGRDRAHDIVKPPGWLPPSHADLVEDFVIDEG